MNLCAVEERPERASQHGAFTRHVYRAWAVLVQESFSAVAFGTSIIKASVWHFDSLIQVIAVRLGFAFRTAINARLIPLRECHASEALEAAATNI